MLNHPEGPSAAGPLEQSLVPRGHSIPEEDSPTTSSPTVLVGVPDALLAEGSTGPLPAGGALMIELDSKSWEDAMARFRTWCGTNLAAQTSYRQLAEDTQERLNERHLKFTYLSQVVDGARRHERAAEELTRMVGGEPSAARKALGEAGAKTREAMASALSVLGPATGGFGRLHMTFLASLDALVTFATAQQLGLALGIREINEFCFPIVNEKFLLHRLLQEVALEGVPQAILYGIEI